MQKKSEINFKELFNTEGAVFASPGRINLIGEHTDYNGGFVFPGAIDKGMIAEIKPNGTGKVRAFSIDLNDYAEFGLNEEDAPKQAGQDTYSVYAVRSSNVAARSRDLIPYLQVMFLWVPVCLHPQL